MSQAVNQLFALVDPLLFKVHDLFLVTEEDLAEIFLGLAVVRQQGQVDR